MASSIGTGLYTFGKDYISFRNSILLTSTLICIAEIIVISLFGTLISDALGFNRFIVIMIGICALGHYIVNFAQISFIYEKKAVSNFALSVSVSILSVLASIVLIRSYDDNYRYLGRIYGVTIVYALAAVVIWFFIFLQKPTGIKKKYFSYAFFLGFPIVFHTLSQQVLGQSDRVMMQQFEISNAEIGIYSLFYTLTSVLSTILGALNNSWCPFYYDDISENRWEAIDAKSKKYIELFTAVSAGFVLLSREVSYIMANEEYWSGINVVPILSIAVYFTFMYQFPVNFEFFHKKTKIIASGTVGAGLFNVILNAILIPIWGMYGAAIATAISYLALFFAHYFIVTHMKNLTFHMNLKSFVLPLLFLGTAVVVFYIFSPWWYIRWAIGIVIGIIELARIIKRRSIF